jgi:hypothetical protein
MVKRVRPAPLETLVGQECCRLTDRATDPDKRGIDDQRYADDGPYQATRSRTPDQWLGLYMYCELSSDYVR